VVKKYGERSGDMKYGQRFRYNNLTQTYAKYKDIFRKRLKQKEEGTVQRHFGAAAKAIEAERAQRLAEANARYATAVAEPVAFRISLLGAGTGNRQSGKAVSGFCRSEKTSR